MTMAVNMAYVAKAESYDVYDIGFLINVYINALQFK